MASDCDREALHAKATTLSVVVRCCSYYVTVTVTIVLLLLCGMNIEMFECVYLHFLTARCTLALYNISIEHSIV